MSVCGLVLCNLFFPMSSKVLQIKPSLSSSVCLAENYACSFELQLIQNAFNFRKEPNLAYMRSIFSLKRKHCRYKATLLQNLSISVGLTNERHLNS